jgi:hypothetical protein
MDHLISLLRRHVLGFDCGALGTERPIREARSQDTLIGELKLANAEPAEPSRVAMGGEQ